VSLRANTLAFLAAAAAVGLLAPGPRGAMGARLSQIGAFQQPVHVDDAPGRKNARLLLVVEKEGRIVVLRNGVLLSVPFLDVSDLVSAGGEQGLLSVAFHPDYERNRLFYVYLTDANGDNAVYEFKRKRKSRVRALRSSARQVLLIPHPDNATNHNGGQLQFGPRKLLYIAPGDGGSTPTSAQDVNALTGKLLRIDPRRQHPRKAAGKRGRNSAGTSTAAGSAAARAGAPYGIPRDNPFVGGPGLDEIYALGLRNPFRFSFDRATGALAIGDVGAGTREEVDYRNRDAARGANFGWPRFEGTVLLNADIQAPGAVPPIFEYATHVNGTCVVTGGYVVRDPRLPGLAGRYLYADLCVGQLRSLIPSQAGASGDTPLGVPTVSSPASFGEGRGGVIYVVSLDGPVYRLDP
jgi:glucose/arabinose dehydrogenase